VSLTPRSDHSAFNELSDTRKALRNRKLDAFAWRTVGATSRLVISRSSFVLFHLLVSKNDVSRRCCEFEEYISARSIRIDQRNMLMVELQSAEGFTHVRRRIFCGEDVMKNSSICSSCKPVLRKCKPSECISYRSRNA